MVTGVKPGSGVQNTIVYTIVLLPVVCRCVLLKLPSHKRGMGGCLSEQFVRRGLQTYLHDPAAIESVTSQRSLPLEARISQSWARPAASAGSRGRGRGRSADGRSAAAKQGNRGSAAAAGRGMGYRPTWQQQLQQRWEQQLQAEFGRHGELQGISMLPYKSSSGKAGATIRWASERSARIVHRCGIIFEKVPTQHHKLTSETA